MRLHLRILALLLVAAPLGAQGATLRVLRHTPGDTASPGNLVTVIFDRPVAGRLDATVDAARLFRIEPAVPGRVAWRDPITIRFVPDEPLTPGDSFTVMIDNQFEALDGTRLEKPYSFAFRVPGPRLLARSFAGESSTYPHQLPLDGKVELVYSAPVNLDFLRLGARLELAGCGAAPRTIALLPLRERPIAEDDPQSFKSAGGWDRDTIADRFRRVVELKPADSLAEGCSGRLVIPTTDEDTRHGREESFAISTAPSFRLENFKCGASASRNCSFESLRLGFSAVVKREDVMRYVSIEPSVPMDLDPRWGQSSGWTIVHRLTPRTKYTLAIDSALRDVNGRALEGVHEAQFVTGDFYPAIGYSRGTLTVPLSGRRSIPLRHVNVRKVRVTSYRIPESQRARALVLSADSLEKALPKLGGSADTVTVTLPGGFNVDTTTELALPVDVVGGASGLVALRVDIVSTIRSREEEREDSVHVSGRLPKVWVSSGRVAELERPHFALIQLSDLAVNAKVSDRESMVLVTGVRDGRPRAGVAVRQLDPEGKPMVQAITDSSGIARLVLYGGDVENAPPAMGPIGNDWPPRTNLVEAVLGSDRVLLPIVRGYVGFPRTNPLDTWQLGANSGRVPLAAATIFADRGIYRPGETLYLGGVVRSGGLDALQVEARKPVRLTLTYSPDGWNGEEAAVVHDTVLTTSDFGTVMDSVRLRPGLELGEYEAALYIGGDSAWREVASEPFTVAEYRAPEFLVEATTDSTPKFGGDTVRVRAAARYLFGAPMGSATVQWSAVLHEVMPWEIEIPGAEGWTVGEWDWSSWADYSDSESEQLSGVDTLGTDGRVELHVPVADLNASRPGRMTIDVAVTDVNRQVISSSVLVSVHPARFYILARKKSHGWFWDAGKSAGTEIRTVRPDGSTISGVAVIVQVVRQNLRWVDNYYPTWSDTVVRTDTIRTSDSTASFSFVPDAGGRYDLRLSAADGEGGTARTSLSAYVLSGGSVWWARSPYHLPLVVGRPDVAVGDTVQVAFDSPFESAEAWVTVERERVLDQRHVLVRSGANVIPVRVTEAHIPNVFVSVLLLSRDAPARPDSAQRLIRAGYTDLRVSAAPKRLAVTVLPHSSEYRPGDTAQVSVRVRDADGRGARSEVALWAVDQGVLALTDFQTPDILARMYEPRGLGSNLWSTLPSILIAGPPLIREVDWVTRSSVGSALHDVVVTGAASTQPSIRTNFRSTAFYLASAVTDDSGNVVLRAKVPDNLTTYRVMAVAVGATDRFGSGDTTMLVTRPLVARPSLPRFVRAGDSLFAGAVVNTRDAPARRATVTVQSDGIRTLGTTRRDIELEAGKGGEARFSFAMPSRDRAPDSVAFLFRASSGAFGDAVRSTLAVKPDFHARAHTIMGSLRDDAEVALELPADIDALRSRLTLRVGVSPLAPMLAAYDWLRVYPYYCTEQIASSGRALIAVWRATRDHEPRALGGDPRPRLQQLADELARRQRSDGAIRYWNDFTWSSPWLSAYAGLFLLDARDDGIVVDDGVLRKLSSYLTESMAAPIAIGGMNRFERRARRLALGDRVAVIDFLRRAGTPDIGAEDALLGLAPQMTWEDRLRLAEVLASRDDARGAAQAMVDDAWQAITPAGRMVDLPDSAFAERAFPSRVAPAARLLTASLALRPDHPWLGALIERVLQEGRAERGWAWSTQDYASVVMALAAVSSGETDSRTVHVRAGARTLLDQEVGVTDSAAAVPLTGLLERTSDGHTRLRLRLSTSRGAKPVYYALTVSEVPSKPPVTPDIQGVTVERWYERFDNGAPVTSVEEGDLVRVRLRVTVPSDREYVAVEDPLPAGLEVVDLSLRTSASLQPFVTAESREAEADGDRGRDGPAWQSWLYGSWAGGWWSPWEHKAVHDDKVVYFARKLWKGSYSASYVARATTSGTFVRPPAHAEEMYNPAVQGRSDGGRFGVERRAP